MCHHHSEPIDELLATEEAEEDERDEEPIEAAA